MKKLFATVLALMLFAIPAFAENFDLTSVDTEELLILRERVDIELSLRATNDSSVIHQGVYYGGETIKPGAYILTCVETGYALVVSLYSGKITSDDRPSPLYTEFLYIGSSMFIMIEEETTLVLEAGWGTLRTAEASWLP